MNINRDFLIILDVKSGEVDSPNIYYFNTDKNTSNLYVQMVLRETTVEANPIENATDYSIKANILKPNLVAKEVDGVLVNEEKAIYEFKLPADCTDFSGNAKIEFEVYCTVDGVDKIATSFTTKFKVHGSVLTEQNKYIEDSSDYPILKELMAEVVEINKTANELDTTIRTLQADMIDANNEMKANEATRQANETARVANEVAREEAERTRATNEVAREEAEATREGQEATRVANENERKTAENQRKANEEARVANEVERNTAEQSRIAQENTRTANEATRQANETARVANEVTRETNEEARITAETARVTEHEQMRTELNEVKAENAVLMENDKKLADRMTQVEISDKRQYVIMEGLINSAGDGYLKIEDTGNDTTLYNSVEGFVDVKNITGNTMVNSIKNPDDELTLNADINTSGQSVTLTTAVDNGQVDVLAEGNTMVNVCDQQEAVAITKSYTVESGNHVALQGEYDGKARPVVHGNTIVNLCKGLDADKELKKLTNTGYMDLRYTTTPNTTCTLILNIKDINLDSQPNLTLGVRGNKGDGVFAQFGSISSINNTGTYSIKLDTNIESGISSLLILVSSNNSNSPTVTISKNIMLLEGDYTNKPIPNYFEGMQSSFEDKVVTQEMVDNGEESAENLGKYRVDYKVTGKNKVNIDNVTYDAIGNDNYYGTVTKTGNSFTYQGNKDKADGNFGIRIRTKLKPNTTYYLSHKYEKINADESCYVRVYTRNSIILVEGQVTTFTTIDDEYYIFNFYGSFGAIANCQFTISDIQLEEGSTATAYEPYKESIKTYYLNSPLLEGDTIEESNGNVYHVHRYGKVVLDGSSDEKWSMDEYEEYINGRIFKTTVNSNVYRGSEYIEAYSDKYPSILSHINNSSITEKCIFTVKPNIICVSDSSYTTLESFKTSIQSIPITVIYKLDSPQYELISQNDTILTDSYVAGHLDFDTAVPISKVWFKKWACGTKYLYTSTNYNIQFEADNVGKISLMYLGNCSLQNLNVVKGINKFTMTTPSEFSFTQLQIEGIGFSASNIVVTEATDKDFGYFSGMKSVGELEENKIEILSRYHYIDYDSNNTTGHHIKPIWTLPTNKISDYLQYFNEVSNYNSCENLFDYYYVSNNSTIWINLGSFDPYEAFEILNIRIAEGEGKLNKKQILLNEPLRAVGDTKDRFVQIDGKWYVERNVAEVVVDGSENYWAKGDTKNGWTEFEDSIIIYTNSNELNIAPNSKFISNKFPYKSGLVNKNEEGISNQTWNEGGLKGHIAIRFNIKTINGNSMSNALSWLQSNPTTVTYILPSPTYEPVEISPTVNTYTDVTHITNNSTIPMNMPIVNSGYELIVKPSTKYTVVGMTNGRIGDSTIVNGTITTPATLDDPFLRPYGTGKTSKVMLLEGEPANIPAYFKGIKSVFEDKVTEDGKYTCEVKVVGKNKFDINSVVNKHSNGISKIDNGIRVTNGMYDLTEILDLDVNKQYTISWNCEQVSGEGRSGFEFVYSDGTHNYRVNTGDNVLTSISGKKISKVFITYSAFGTTNLSNIQIEEGTVASEYEPYHETKQTLYLDEPLYNTNNITIYNDKLGYWKNWDKVVLDGSDDEGWKDSDNNLPKTYRAYAPMPKASLAVPIANYLVIDSGTSNKDFESLQFSETDVLAFVRLSRTKANDIYSFKQYLSQNPVTVVYQLAEPEFVTLVKDTPNWIIGSWDNCSIHFDSIIPLKDTRYRYTGNVPSVVAMSDDVATVSDISDQQDSMIIDLATQVATMEMMLM